MGFGLLLIGYTFAYLITIGLGNYAFAGLILGHFIMYLGIGELKKYSPAFIYAYIMSVMLIICSDFECVKGIDVMLNLGLGISGSGVANIFEISRFIFDAAFNVALLYGIIELSVRVDYPDTKFKSTRNLIFVGLYFVFQIIVSALSQNPGEHFEKYSSFMMTLVLLFKLIYVVLNIGVIFKCYAFICPFEDVNMERKPSRFEFVNKMRERTDANEQKAIEETQKYLEQRAQRKKEKREKKYSQNNKNHKKK